MERSTNENEKQPIKQNKLNTKQTQNISDKKNKVAFNDGGRDLLYFQFHLISTDTHILFAKK